MKQYNINVLAKGQVVIPKELRDELCIDVGDSMSCFMRGSALVLKKRMQTMEYVSEDQFPLGIDQQGETQSMPITKLKGITCLLGKSGFGKSVHALNMMMNMYISGKSIIVLDPYGDWIAEIKNYIADFGDADMYQYTLGESEDRNSLKSEIKKNAKQKVIAIHGNFQGIGAKKSAELADGILRDCYSELVDDTTAIFLDEFGIYFNEGLRTQIITSQGYTCILDQGWDYLSREQIKRLFKNINHIALYQVGGLMAKYLVEDLGLLHTTQELRTIEKYHFYFHSTGDNDSGRLLTGIHPLH